MQDNLRLVMWTLAALIGAWVVTMTVQRNMFIYSNVSAGLHGVVSMNKTDIGGQCGAKWVNSTQQVLYKVDNAGHLLYLCPRGLWPIQNTIQGVTLTNGFKSSVSDETLSALNVLYPGATNPVSDPGAVINAPPAQTSTPVQPVAPSRQQVVTPPSSPLTAAPHLTTPLNQIQAQPSQNGPQGAGSQTVPGGKRAPAAKPLDASNPFLGAPAPNSGTPLR
jgi:hypothetical protein